MTGAFLFSDRRRPSTTTRGRVYGGGVFDRHVTRWNDNCVFCHNVAPNPGRDPATGAFETTVAELGIACEACHGPGAEHARANADPSRRYALHLAPRGRPDDRQPVAPVARARRRHLRPLPRPADHRRRRAVPGPRRSVRRRATISRATAGRCGATRRSRRRERVRGALLGGRHAAADRLRIPGPAAVARARARAASPAPAATACTRAIRAASSASASPAPNADRDVHAAATRRWPRRPPLAAHAHHDPAGEGARCVGCHMPRIVYGVLDVHRSHRIEIPKCRRDDPHDAGYGAGRPDACTALSRRGPRRAASTASRHPSLLAVHGRSGRRARSPPMRWAARRRSAATSARVASGRCSGAWPSDAIRRSATSRGGACAD